MAKPKPKGKLSQPYSTKAEALAAARRKWENAKKVASGVEVVHNRFMDAKPLQMAAGIGYLATLDALNAYLLSRGADPGELPESIQHYRQVVGKMGSASLVAMNYLNTAYESLHVSAYYRANCSKGNWQDGLDAAWQLIELVAGLPEPKLPRSHSEGKPRAS
jgi:hypothetical protein